MDKVNLQVIRESFGRVVYTHKTHEKEAELVSQSVARTKWVNIIITALMSGTLVSAIIANVTDDMTLSYVSAGLATLTLAFTLYRLSFNPEERVERHRQVAKELLRIRESHVALMADIKNDILDEDATMVRRDELLKELSLVYKFAPTTSPKAYERARKALNVNEEFSFSNSEIDQFLPDELKLDNQ